MGQINQQLQALLDDVVAFLSLDIRDEADTARVVLVARVVKPLRLRKSFRRGIFILTHRGYFPCAASIVRRLDNRICPCAGRAARNPLGSVPVRHYRFRGAEIRYAVCHLVRHFAVQHYGV